MFYLIIFLFGLAGGSFLNVVICRLKTKKTIFFGHSYCPKCRAVLKWYDLIPVLSFLAQRAKCRYCRKKISWQYPLVEIATGLLFVLIFNQFYPDYINLVYYLIISSLLLVIFVYDLKHYIIPDKIVFPGIIVSLIYLIYLEASLPNIWGGVLTGLGAGGFFLALVLVSKGKWMGLGDVKLAFFMGLILGWPNILTALFLAFSSGAIVGLILIALKKKGLKSEIPFGPFLAGSTLITMLYPVDKFVFLISLFGLELVYR